MKKSSLLNAPASAVVAKLGHTDSICICDAGLPIPDGPERIDLAVTKHIPSLIDVLEPIVEEMMVEKIAVARELAAHEPEYTEKLMALISALEESQGNEIEIEHYSHEDFKHQTTKCRAIIRTGECTPFANIILYSGVTF